MLSRREFLKTGAMAGAYAGLAGLMPRIAEAAGEGKYNVLFIAVDDMRTTLGCYGAPVIKTPNIDRIAASGTVFNRAYCQQALCSPSRSSLLTGKRPDTTQIYNLTYHFRKYLPDTVTLPQCFKQNGYHSQGFSKIFHGGLDDPDSWTLPHWSPGGPMYLTPEGLAAREKLREQLVAEGKDFKEHILETDPKTGMPTKIDRADVKLRGPAWEAPDCPDNALGDGMTTDKAVECLGEIKDKPFFLAVGFNKPHLPFVAPKKYYDLYEPKTIKLASNPFPPKDMPEVAFYNSAEMRAYTDIPDLGKGPINRDKARELIRAYYACVSYTDAQIGRIVDELERLGLRDKTIICLWGDHGWQLGEHDIWCKHTNFEEATHAPLIISAPNQQNKGAKTEALAEFVDIYPTLCDLAGIPAPKDLEGTSLAPVMENPKRPWKKAAFSQYPRPDNVMGYSMRTDRYRYTEWQKKGSDPVAVELYDYRTDPQGNVNIAGLPESRGVVKELAGQLKAGWKAAKP